MNPQQKQPINQTTQTAQPLPSTNDFLSRMDAVNHPVAPEPPKKKLPKNAIIGIVVGAVVLVVAIVAVIILLNSGKEEPQPTAAPSYEEPDESEIDEEMEARNKLRANDLKALGEAVKLYQADPESEGQLPGTENEEWNGLIYRYVPNGVLTDGATGDFYVIGAVCKFGESCVDISTLSWENNAHQIFALYNADCKGSTKENVIVSSTRLRRVAIFAIVEGDQFICTTN